MPEIPYDEETTRDWDWFAVDEDGNIAHFATAGFRRLPVSVRSDWERAEELIRYFESLPAYSEYVVCPEFWSSEKAPKTEVDGERYFRYFVKMARAGLFSYDTVLRVPGDYFAVTAPTNPLKLGMLPAPIQEYLAKTRSSVRFRQAANIPEVATLSW